MTKEEILSVVSRHIRLNVDGLEDEVIDSSSALADLGAGSLDIVEIVSSAMRELRIRVPRTQLSGLKNIDDLVDLFAEIKSRDS